MEQGYQVRELQPGLWAIEDGHVRMFLLEGSEKALLLDTGFGTGDLCRLISSLTKKPLMLVISNSDRDHVGGCAQFEGDVFLHPAEF